MERLKTWATLGPACHESSLLAAVLETGISGFRLNLSHSMLEENAGWIRNLREAEQISGKQADLLIDMKGPELRISKRPQPLELVHGAMGRVEELGLPDVLRDRLEPGMELELDDGKIRVRLKDRTSFQVLRGGLLESGKSVHVPALEGKLNDLPVLQKEDLVNLRVAKQAGVNALMQPFVRSRQDLLEVRQVLDDLDLDLKVFAKIENLQGLDRLETFLDLADCIVIARGDLANAAGLERIGAVQHQIETICHRAGREYMVVTEMLDSMCEREVCTRAEVSDIFHAVYNGASHIMITKETAAGKHPLEACRMLNAAARSALEELARETDRKDERH